MYEIRTVYFFLQQSPLQFKICAIFQLFVDLGKQAPYHRVVIDQLTTVFVVIAGQRIVYGNAPPMSVLLQENDELEQALSLAEE